MTAGITDVPLILKKNNMLHEIVIKKWIHEN